MDSLASAAPKVPFIRLLPHLKHFVAITADGSIYVLNSESGKVTHTTVTNQEQSDALRKSGAIVAANIDENADYLVTASADKMVRVWELDGLRVVSEREASKKPTDVRFSRNADKVILCDKFGDVHCYPRMESPTGASETKDTKTKRKDAQRLHDDSLLLGHVSLLTTFLLSPDEQFIITADRDEHIRISWYPQSFTIEQFCLGHLKFVSALHIPSFDNTLLISGGGDTVLKVWKWLDGKLLTDIHIADVVMPYIKVTRTRSSRGADGSDDEEKEKTGKKLSSRQRRRVNKKSKAKDGDDKELNEDEKDDASNTPAQDEMDVDGEAGSTENAKSKDGPRSGTGEVKAEPLLAVQKIETISDGSTRLLVFSVHGATAIFYCQLSSTDSPQVSALDLEQPVLDFAIHQDSNKIYVSTDANWSEDTPGPSNPFNSVRLLKTNGTEQLVVDDGSTLDSLLDALNDISRSSVSPDELSKIDLYSALSTLPKNVDFDNNAVDDNVESEATGNQLSGKELGRLKAKKAAMALEAKRKTAETPSDGPETKRKKNDGEDV